MRIEDIKVGMKVKPIAKTNNIYLFVYKNIEEYFVMNSSPSCDFLKENGFLYVNDIGKNNSFYKDDRTIVCGQNTQIGGDYFYPEDLIPYGLDEKGNYLLEF